MRQVILSIGYPNHAYLNISSNIKCIMIEPRDKIISISPHLFCYLFKIFRNGGNACTDRPLIRIQFGMMQAII